MPLSRLDNFLKNVKGNILYVDPDSLDATDSVDNTGSSAARPFKSIQRALIEASRYSYQKGLDNDRFEKTTVIIKPGLHYIDNRPGWIPTGSNQYLLRSGITSSDLPSFSNTSNFDILDENNVLYKLNSVHGGVIIPRGVSLVGKDLRKTLIRPLYVPNPENTLIEKSCLFRLTGAAFASNFSMKDADTNKGCFKDYSTNKYVPTFSHHKLTCFMFADGANNVNIDDDFITYSTDRTDLDMYYEKVGIVYGPASGREIEPDYPNSGVDIQPKIDEFRIVGPTSGQAGISSIKAGNGVTPTNVITVNTTTGIFGLNVDTNVIINDVSDARYNGTYIVTGVQATDSTGVTQFTYEVPNVPGEALPNPLGTSVELSSDTVTSASPYIYSCSLRSVYGMCGVHVDGKLTDGFKSVVVAQFSAISLQVDDKAFVKYNSTSGTFDDSTTVPNLHTDIDAIYKPAYENYHIRTSNDGFVQITSIFAIGFSNQFVSDSGGDSSITNSNSNFGQIALTSRGFKTTTFNQDDNGYVTQVIPPKSLRPERTTVEFPAFDISNTVSIGNSSRLYMYEYNNIDTAPPSVIQGYRFGAKKNESVSVLLPDSGTTKVFTARVVMDNTANTSNEVTGKKLSRVGNNVSTGNSITNSTLTFIQDHQFLQGESVRVIANDARLPDGLNSNKVYFAIVDGLPSDQIQLARSFNDSLTSNKLSINNLGGTLTVESRVNDKNPGDAGHPIQFDSTNDQWFVNVSSASTENNLYPKLTGGGLGEATPRTYITRQKDTRQADDRIHKLRYVIPSNTGSDSARPPQNGFVIQESGNVTGINNTEVQLDFNPGSVTMTSDIQMRNFSFISNVNYKNGIAFYSTEQPHRLSVGSTVQINNVTSTLFPTVGAGNSGYNGTYTVTGITSAKTFEVSEIKATAGSFTNNTSQRTTALPTFSRKSFNKNYYVYDVETINDYRNGEQDGIYYLSVLNSSNIPEIAPFNIEDYSFSQPIRNYYPQLDRDNPKSCPETAACYALPGDIGQVIIDDPLNTLTGETLEELFVDTGVGIGLTDIVSDNVGTAYTLFTSHDHGLNRITVASVNNGGAGYGDGSSTIQYYYNAVLENITAGSVGRNATALVTVDGTSSGEIIDVQIMDGGSSYVVGDNMRVVGIATTTGYSAATIGVNKIYDNRDNTLQIQGINNYDGRVYNDLYKITAVSDFKEVEVVPLNGPLGINTTGIGLANASSGGLSILGDSYKTSSFVYNKDVGLATVTTNYNNQFRVNNSVVVSGATDSFFNGSHVCVDKIGLTTVVLDVGIHTVMPTMGGAIEIHPNAATDNFGDLVVENGRLHGREHHVYAGITTTLSAAITSKTTDTINVSNMTNFDFLIGDYLIVNDELMRVKTTVSRVSGATQLKVFRGVYGSFADTHAAGTVVRRVFFYPLEFRRNSLVRASGHTFEYVGYGPGNYSTAFPSKQTKQLTLQQQFNVQSQKSAGGVINYTGMNDRGDFYIGRKRFASTTGKEQVIDTPIQTVSGEDPYIGGIVDDTSNFNYTASSVVKVERNVIVDGGDKGNILSQFNGPVEFSQKVVSTSNEGIEANSVFLQGNTQVSRRITVGIATPSNAANPGDLVFNATPESGGTVGWVYTTNNEWKSFGTISS